jgi:error-prone DNA polymerase
MPNRNIIQWDKDDCEQLKIVKVDLLGLGMMAVLRDSITLIKEHHGEDLGLYKIPNDDPKVYEALQNADTVGMFQVESRAQIAFLPKSKPREFYDIVVQVAIIRPGPVVGKMLSSYIKRRQGLEQIDHIHPRLVSTLKRTLGVPLFQEQLLKIAMEIADFTGSEAEELRRAMGFKRPDRRMEKIEANLRAGMNRNRIDDKTQDTIVKCVKAFANYGFPESHAFSFALLAYASAYFMVHYRAGVHDGNVQQLSARVLFGGDTRKGRTAPRPAFPAARYKSFSIYVYRRRGRRRKAGPPGAEICPRSS